MKLAFRPAAALLLASLLAACGGGGGDPGTCHGSPQVCSEGQGSTANTNTGVTGATNATTSPAPNDPVTNAGGGY